MNILEARRRLLGADVYKKTAEGNPISVRSLVRMYPGITMQGWTEQTSTTGAQLINSDELVIGGLSGDNGNEFGTQNRIRTGFIAVTAGQNYTISGYSPYTIANTHVFQEDKITRIGSFSNTAPIPEGGAFVRVSFKKTDNSDLTEDDLSQLKATAMFNIGNNTVKPYEPYTGGQPSPSPEYPQEIVNAGSWNEESQKWEYEVKVQGKNLIPFPYLDSDKTQNGLTFTVQEDGGVKVNGTATAITFFNLCKIHFGDSSMTIIRPSNGEYVISGSVEGANVQYDSNNDYTYISISNGTTVNNQIIYPQVEYGTEPTAYEPYRTPQIVLLQSDRPLTKWDRLEKRDGQWGWVYKSGAYTVTGEENFISASEQYHGEKTSSAYFINNDMVLKADSNLNIGIGYCERLRLLHFVWTEYLLIGFSYNVDQIHIRLSNTDTGVTTEDTLTDIANKIKEYVGQQYQEGNPFIFWYETTEETFVPLTEAEQEQMNALHTNYPTTVLVNDQGCNMKLTYKTKKSLEVR